MFSQRMNPAQLRGAPLGWYFTLFFLIQGFMPLGGAIAIAANMEEPAVGIAVAAIGVLLSGALVTFLVRTALRAKKRVSHFEEAKKGRRAQGQILSVEELGQAGTVKSGGNRTSYWKLRVHVRAMFEDRIPFDLAEEACYTSRERAAMSPGTMVWLSLHPSGQGPFLIDPDSLQPQPMKLPAGIRMPQGPQVQIKHTDDGQRRW